MASIKQGVITAENQETLLLSSHRLFAVSARTILKKQFLRKEMKTGYTSIKIRQRIRPSVKLKKPKPIGHWINGLIYWTKSSYCKTNSNQLQCVTEEYIVDAKFILLFGKNTLRLAATIITLRLRIGHRNEY